MAKTKKQKEAMLAQYGEWLERSQAVILVEYTGMKMADLDAVRAKMREAGGEFHVVKNTLIRLALQRAGWTAPSDFYENSTAVGFAFHDAAGVSKAFYEAVKNLPVVKVKGGFLGAKALTPEEVKALAELPPLETLRSQLMGLLLAPANQFVRTLAEPGRQVASVLKAYSEKSPAAI